MNIPIEWIHALLGGLCIGVASVGLMLFNGRIAGISGISFMALKSPISNTWAVVFVAGLALGAYLFHSLFNVALPAFNVEPGLIVAGGFIVGLGTKLGSGCTSGHGICGIGRLSMRSIIATGLFMSAGIATVLVRLHGGF